MPVRAPSAPPRRTGTPPRSSPPRDPSSAPTRGTPTMGEAHMHATDTAVPAGTASTGRFWRRLGAAAAAVLALNAVTPIAPANASPAASAALREVMFVGN